MKHRCKKGRAGAMIKIAICDDEENMVILQEKIVRDCLKELGIGCEIASYTVSANLLYDICFSLGALQTQAPGSIWREFFLCARSWALMSGWSGRKTEIIREMFRRSREQTVWFQQFLFLAFSERSLCPSSISLRWMKIR